jgi:hypothetical protein
MRALVSAAASCYALWSLEAFAPRSTKVKDLFHVRIYEVGLLVGIVLFLLLFNFKILPQSFVDDLPSHKCAIPPTFREIMVPYFPYFIYVFFLYVGIVCPVFFVLIRRSIFDWRSWQKASSTLRVRCLRRSADYAFTLDGIQDVLFKFQNHIVMLKHVAERYIPVLLAVCFVLLYEEFTPSHSSVTPQAVEVGKAILWLLLGPALLISVSVVAFGYQNAARTIEGYLRAAVLNVQGRAGAGEIFEKASSIRTSLIWQQNPGDFILTIFKSGSVLIPLLIALAGYVLKSIGGPDGWFHVFVPLAVTDFLKRLYGL